MPALKSRMRFRVRMKAGRGRKEGEERVEGNKAYVCHFVSPKKQRNTSCAAILANLVVICRWRVFLWVLGVVLDLFFAASVYDVI